MHINWLAQIAASLMPMIIGFIYYHPNVLGGTWMKANGFTMEGMTPPKPMLYGVAWGLSFILAFWCRLQFEDPHQTTMKLDGTDHNYVTFGHGLAHGVIYSLMVVLPILGTMAIFEKRSLNWVFVNVGYWMLTLSAMCAIVCGWR